MTKDDIAGVYRQLGEDAVGADGSVTEQAPRTSQIMYSADGYMAVVSTLADRARVTGADGATNLDGASAQDRAAATRGMVSYAGRYVLKDGIVEHHVEVALNPNMVGQVVTRRVAMNGDDLTLSSVPAADGSHRWIRWRRVR